MKKNGLSPFQNMSAYLGGSAIQTVGDNPVTAYRQLVQQYAKGLDGKAVDPKVASAEAKKVNKFTPPVWLRVIFRAGMKGRDHLSCLNEISVQISFPYHVFSPRPPL